MHDCCGKGHTEIAALLFSKCPALVYATDNVSFIDSESSSHLIILIELFVPVWTDSNAPGVLIWSLGYSAVAS
jgi:hypothetical protein